MAKKRKRAKKSHVKSTRKRAKRSGKKTAKTNKIPLPILKKRLIKLARIVQSRS